eukprot:GHVU01075295.1.p1 GENE.GHVU01075295.1~~GHVU01075295.1.p1  ORF type:complete len:809 (+),score=19.46 GHVU01075295.1:1-2427(+)
MEGQWKVAVPNILYSSYDVAYKDDASLQDFFRRPIRIATYSWPQDGGLATTFNPWDLYFSQARVINRMTNFNLLRSKLCVRFLINGNGFFWGKAMASYYPLFDYDDSSMATFTVPQSLIEGSQRMHVWLDSTKSQGGDMCLPYVYFKNAMSITSADWSEMGEIALNSMSLLRHGNGLGNDLTITVLAWAEDVQLSIPTAVDPVGIVPQAGDEYTGSGPISGPATTVAKISGALESVPGISPYAKATSVAAGAAAKVAKAFGMSRPVDNSGIASYKPAYMGNLANSNVIDTSTKLTYDVKQELSIDPRTVGISAPDEMSLKYLAQKESYYTQFKWGTAASVDSHLFSSRVSPVLYDTHSALQRMYMTPMCHSSMPFKNWRGSIKFRFQVAASAFMKGRLRITYDPNTSADAQYNVQYSYILDLAEQRDLVVECGWTKGRTFLQVDDAIPDDPQYSTAVAIATREATCSGIITVTPITQLTASEDGQSADIYVSVSACNDFELVNPDGEQLQKLTYFAPQSGFVNQSGEVSADADATVNESRPTMDGSDIVMAPKLNVDHTYDVYYGDPIQSIRQLIKRYDFWGTWGIRSVNPSTDYIKYDLPDFPFYPGYGEGIHRAATPADPTNYTYCRMTHMNWFTPIFLCRRGGIRWKYTYANTGTSVASGTLMSVARHARPRDFGFTILTSNVFGAATTYNRIAYAMLNSLPGAALAGTTSTIVNQNPTLEVELPFHTNSRFQPAKLLTRKFLPVDRSSHELVLGINENADNKVSYATAFVSGGEDFALMYFQSIPPIYRQDTIPAPSGTVEPWS